MIVNRDAEQFKNQHPEYSDDPMAEIKNSLAILKTKSQWKERYNEFIETMVYDNSSVLEYESALEVLETLSSGILDSLHLETV